MYSVGHRGDSAHHARWLEPTRQVPAPMRQWLKMSLSLNGWIDRNLIECTVRQIGDLRVSDLQTIMSTVLSELIVLVPMCTPSRYRPTPVPPSYVIAT